MKLQKYAWLFWPRMLAALPFVFLNFQGPVRAEFTDDFQVREAEIDPNDPARAVAEDNTAFAIDLYQQLRREEGNLFFSPFSVSAALAMTYGGARNETAREMAGVLHFDLLPERLHLGFSHIFRSFEEHSPGRLTFANRLWLQKDFAVLDDFIVLTRDRYQASLARVNFRNKGRARRTINDWVAQRTDGKIQDTIPKNIIQTTTRCILTNVIYFQGDWAHKFSRENTKDLPFYLGGDRAIRVPTMYQKYRRRRVERPVVYLEDEDTQILQLYYADSLLSMVIFLPRKADGLPQLEAKLTAEFLLEWMAEFDRNEGNEVVEIFLPKFSVTSEFKMKDTLQQMGMELAFGDDSDFSGIHAIPEEELVLQEVVHKAFVEVHEQGTEAAGATAVATATRGGPSVRKTFKADRPFLFLIRDSRSGSVLFMGRVTNPLESFDRR